LPATGTPSPTSGADHVRRGWDDFRDRLNNPAFFELVGDLRVRRCSTPLRRRLQHAAPREARRRSAGVDISSRMIELAREEEGREPLGVRYEVASFSDLSAFRDESFDVVVSTMALMDSPDFHGALSEIHRLLRRRGGLFFSVTHPCYTTNGSEWRRCRWQQGDCRV
jgi:SAM-dependent methyltransferase